MGGQCAKIHFQEQAHGLKEGEIVSKHPDSMNLKRIFYPREESLTVQDLVKV